METGKGIFLAQETDLKEIESLYIAVCDYLIANTNYPGWKMGKYPSLAVAKAGIQTQTLFLYRLDGQVAGTVILNHSQDNHRREDAYEDIPWGIEATGEEVLVVHTLAVNPKFMKKGVAEDLMVFAKEHAIALGAKTLRLDVTGINTPAITLYEKMGYRYVTKVDLEPPYEHLKWITLYELILPRKGEYHEA